MFMVKIFLTPKQKEMVRFARLKGDITLNETWKFYSTDNSRRMALDRLIILGILEDVENQTFKYIEIEGIGLELL